MSYNPVIETKSLRKDLDAILQDMKVHEVSHDGDIAISRSSRERSLAVTRVQEAIMWLGMDLKAMNEEGMANLKNPYPDSYNPSNDRVEPTADGLTL